MSDPNWVARVGDVNREIVAILGDEAGPADLTGCTVTFVADDARGHRISGICVLTLPLVGKVTYILTASDLDSSTCVPGMYAVNFRVVYPNTCGWTYPDPGSLDLKIEAAA